jgi:hypothetical protein
MNNPFNRIPVLVRSPLRFGFIAGVLGFGLLVILYFIGGHPLLVGFLDFRIILLAVFLVFCLKELREYYFDGLLYFWQGMIASFVLTIVFAFTAAGLLVAFGMFVPRFVSRYIEESIARLKEYPPEIVERIGKDVFERNLATLPSTTAFDLALLYFWQCFVISFFISIIISVILRRQPQIQ